MPLLVCIVLAADGDSRDEMRRQCESLATAFVARLGELNPPAAEPAVRICLLPVCTARSPQELRTNLLGNPDVGGFLEIVPEGSPVEAYEMALQRFERHARGFQGRPVPSPIMISFVDRRIEQPAGERLRRAVGRIRDLEFPAVQSEVGAGRKVRVEYPAVAPWLFAFAPDGEVPADVLRMFASSGFDEAGRLWPYCRWLQHPGEFGERCVQLIAALCERSEKQSAVLASVFPPQPRMSGGKTPNCC